MLSRTNVDARVVNVMVMVNGARMLTPGIARMVFTALEAFDIRLCTPSGCSETLPNDRERVCG